MAKGFSISIILVVVALTAVAAVFLLSNRESSVIMDMTSSVGVDEISEVRSSLLQAIDSSGEISPETYDEVEGKIELFEERGYDKEKTDELRYLLSQLKVGGQGATASGENVQSETVVQETEPSVKLWLYRDGKWQKPVGDVPACPNPLVLQAPVDLDLVTSILYPGQVRGGDFKPHGGFRTDGATGPVKVTAPLEGYIWRVAKFNDSAGLHYMFDVQHPCGIMYRLGHLSAVPANLETIFDDFPKRQFGDSRTEEVEPVFVKVGDTIATNIQLQTGFDWGVYDLRNENEASKDPAFREAYTASDAEQAFNAICWFGYLPAEQESIVRSLPAADGQQGKNSAYCN